MFAVSGDLRYGWRSMRANPGFAAVAIASLALGIGVNTTIFSLVDQLLLWRVAASEPSRLVEVQGAGSETYPFYREYRRRNHVLSGMLAGSRPIQSGVRPEGAPAVEVAEVCYVSGNYFQMLGVAPSAGRILSDTDESKPGGSPVAVLAFHYWQGRFAGSRVLGRKIAVNGYPIEVVGVAGRGFGGIANGERPDIFIPLTMYPAITPAAARVWNTPQMKWLTTMGRLRVGESAARVQADLRAIWPQAVDAVNSEAMRNGRKARKYDQEQAITVAPGLRGAHTRNGAREPLTVLMVATGLVLLIACANLANLLLARSAARRKEIAIRLALGAGRARLVQQLLTENLLLAVAGGAVGIGIAYGSTALLARASLIDPSLRFQPGTAVMLYCVCLTVATGLVFGLAPALRSTRMDLSQATKDGGASTATAARLRLGKALIAAQAGLSVILLAGAGLFIRTLHNLQSVDLGFQRESVVILDIDASKLGYKGARLRAFYDELLARTRHIRQVRSASLAGMTPMSGYSMARSFSAEGYEPAAGETPVAYSNPVSEGYFASLGIPILLGRDFLPQDEPAVTPEGGIFAALGRMGGGGNETVEHGSHVCIVNESFARRLFGGANPLGRRISFDDRVTPSNSMEIVGVVKDVRQSDVRQADKMGMIYVPSWNSGAEARWLAARISGSTAEVVAAVRKTARDMDPNVPLLASGMLSDAVGAELKQERMIAYLCSAFAALALGLAAVGLYGVMAYAASQRTREIGIRVALGAARANVIAMMLREGLAPVAFGIAIGLAASVAATRAVGSLLFGVAPRDPVSFLTAVITLLVVALTAVIEPARRASRADPMSALRHE